MSLRMSATWPRLEQLILYNSTSLDHGQLHAFVEKRTPSHFPHLRAFDVSGLSQSVLPLLHAAPRSLARLTIMLLDRESVDLSGIAVLAGLKVLYIDFPNSRCV